MDWVYSFCIHLHSSVTIDTLQELSASGIPPTTEALEHKTFFLDSVDETARKVGAKMELVERSDDLVGA